MVSNEIEVVKDLYQVPFIPCYPGINNFKDL